VKQYIVLLLLLMSAGNSVASDIPSGYLKVAREYHIPSKIFFSIALQESGKKWNDGRFLPWPWTLNVQGKAKRYQTKDAACMALRFHTKSNHSTDIGLMQIHWQSHSNRLKKGADPCLLLHPPSNLRLAAVIYKEQYRRSKNVWTAVGHYHNPSRVALQEKYKSLVKKHYRRLS